MINLIRKQTKEIEELEQTEEEQFEQTKEIEELEQTEEEQFEQTEEEQFEHQVEELAQRIKEFAQHLYERGCALVAGIKRTFVRLVARFF